MLSVALDGPYTGHFIARIWKIRAFFAGALSQATIGPFEHARLGFQVAR